MGNFVEDHKIISAAQDLGIKLGRIRELHGVTYGQLAAVILMKLQNGAFSALGKSEEFKARAEEFKDAEELTKKAVQDPQFHRFLNAINGAVADISKAHSLNEFDQMFCLFATALWAIEGLGNYERMVNQHIQEQQGDVPRH